VLVTAPGAEDLAGKGLKAIDPARYGSLQHPGDGYSFDIFTQVARAVREGGPPMGNMKPRRILAVGESQSAIALTTYYNGVQPLTQAFDSFLVHSRAAVSLPLVGPGQFADLAGSIGSSTPATFRTDLDAPVLDPPNRRRCHSVLNSVAVRQPDSDRFRLWEIAGTAQKTRSVAPCSPCLQRRCARSAGSSRRETLSSATDPNSRDRPHRGRIIGHTAQRRSNRWLQCSTRLPRAHRFCRIGTSLEAQEYGEEG
jgi:Alpha/beta hydrolase domain